MTTFANAKIILEDRVITGLIETADGLIQAVKEATEIPLGALDCGGDYIAPGLVELHTDNLERHMSPRPGVDWPHSAAIMAHDAELASVGITTVFDAIRVGSLNENNGKGYGEYARAMATELLEMRDKDALKISHHIHLRAEICSETLLDELAKFDENDRVGMVSLMDHTPGQRQFRDESQLEKYLMGKHGYTREQYNTHTAYLKDLQAKIGEKHELGAVAEARRFGAILASHDDTYADHVARSAEHGVVIAEFPTTVEAAKACHEHGIAVMMGAPNLIRGGSHSGNVAAHELASQNLLDVVSSDYVPSGLLSASIKLADIWNDLPRGIRAATINPARAANMDDRGAIQEGLRADLIRFRIVDGAALMHGVWVKGERVS